LADLLVKLLGLVVRLGLLLAGLVFFVSLLAAAVLVLAAWLARALWATLTGKPVSPWSFKVNRQAAMDRFYRRHRDTRGAPVPDDVVDAQVRDVSVVTDVEPKRITRPPC
jgi:hypothetical protein